MALDFPANPTDGETFDAYIWNASKGVWQAKEESATVAVMSPTAPAVANPGDIWINTITGIAFAYYNDGNTSQWMEILSSAVPAVNEIMPYGTIVQTARSTAPNGWLLCHGQLVSRTTYAGLFSAIGTTYGTGDGSTTFGIPNLQGRIPIGRDSTQTEFDTLGETGGEKAVALLETQIPSHSHTNPSHTHTYSGTSSSDGNHYHTSGANSNGFVAHATGGGGYAVGFTNAGSGEMMFYRYTDYAGTHTHSYSGTTSSAAPTTNATGGGLAHTNLQPYIVTNYMIKV